MKKYILLLGILIGGLAYSQVGINTETPKATFDVMAAPADLTKTDGFIAPRLKGFELKAKDANYTTSQTGAIVYVTEILTPANTTAKTINVTSLGYFYFDGSIWQKMAGATYVEPWYATSTNAPATLNTQDIFQIGKVAVGKNTATSNLDVAGSFRSGDSHSGTVGLYSSILGGNTNQATATNSAILGGVSNIASGTNSGVGGNGSQASGYASFSFGDNIRAGSASQFSVGAYNAITSGTANNNSIVATDALFQIGNGTGSGLRSNAVTVLKSGNTGIGITGTEDAAKPTERLDIGSGNVRIRNINSNTGASTDKIVVADTNGVLKTVVPESVDIPKISAVALRTSVSTTFAQFSEGTLTFNSVPKINSFLTYNSSTGLFTVQKAGYFQISLYLMFDNESNPSGQTNGTADTRIYRNGIRIGGNTTGHGERTDFIHHSVTTTAYFNVGDQIRMAARFTQIFKFGEGSNVAITYLGS